MEILTNQKKDIASKLATNAANDQRLHVTLKDLQAQQGPELENRIKELELQKRLDHETVAAKTQELHQAKENLLHLEKMLNAERKSTIKDARSSKIP